MVPNWTRVGREFWECSSLNLMSNESNGSLSTPNLRQFHTLLVEERLDLFRQTLDFTWVIWVIRVMAIFYTIDLFVTTLVTLSKRICFWSFTDLSALGLDLDPLLDLHFDLKWFYVTTSIAHFSKRRAFPFIVCFPTEPTVWVIGLIIWLRVGFEAFSNCFDW